MLVQHIAADSKEVFDYSKDQPFEVFAEKINTYSAHTYAHFARKVKFIEGIVPSMMEAIKTFIASGYDTLTTKSQYCDIVYKRRGHLVVVCFVTGANSLEVISDGYRLMDGNFTLTVEILASRLIKVFQTHA